MTEPKSNEPLSAFPAKPKRPTALITYVEDHEVAEIGAQADACGLSRAAYVRIIVRQWMAGKGRTPTGSIFS